MESITSYNGIDFTGFLKELTRLYEDAANAYFTGNIEKEYASLNEAYGMEEAFRQLFGDKLSLVRADKVTEHIIIER